MIRKLTITALKKAAVKFADLESAHNEPSMYGVTDGKAIGTYLEHKFRAYLAESFAFEQGSSAKGIDIPSLGVDIKTTSIRQPQSSCPFKSARQKIYGLGYALLVFVYDKSDNDSTKSAQLNLQHVIFVDADRTADHQMTRGLSQILDNNGNEDDLIAFMKDRFLPVDEIEATKLAEELLSGRPKIGYLTISNALQWRLQYKRIIQEAGDVDGLHRLR